MLLLGLGSRRRATSSNFAASSSSTRTCRWSLAKWRLAIVVPPAWHVFRCERNFPRALSARKWPPIELMFPQLQTQQKRVTSRTSGGRRNECENENENEKEKRRTGRQTVSERAGERGGRDADDGVCNGPLTARRLLAHRHHQSPACALCVWLSSFTLARAR